MVKYFSEEMCGFSVWIYHKGAKKDSCSEKYSLFVSNVCNLLKTI